MIRLNWILIVFNLFMLALINVLILFSVFERNDYDFGANALVVTCILCSIYTLKNMHSIKWFGKAVESGHTSNLTISKIFSLVCLIPAFFMNLHPFLEWIGG
jgi:hypothetical protein